MEMGAPHPSLVTLKDSTAPSRGYALPFLLMHEKVGGWDDQGSGVWIGSTEDVQAQSWNNIPRSLPLK